VRLTAILLFSFGGLLLLFGTLTGSWFTVDKEEAAKSGREYAASFSLREATVCDPEEDWLFALRQCREVSYSDIGAADSESIAIMKITWALGLLGCLWMGACAILIGLAVRVERGFAIAAAVVASACFLAAVGVNVIRPRLLTELDASVGASFWLYVLGALCGLAGGICGSRVRRAVTPADVTGDPRAHFPPELSAPPPPGAPRTAIPSPVPLPSPPVEPRPCTRCQAAARWVPGYRRHWCDACTNWV
jgi:hypothetical protein